MNNTTEICILVASAIIGAVLGYFIGDSILKLSEVVRPKDVLEYRVGYPLGGVVFFLVVVGEIIYG